MFTTTGLHHLALRVTSLARSKAFYRDVFSMQVRLEVDDLVLLGGHGLMLGLRVTAGAERVDAFDPTRVGLDHLALGVRDLAVLERLQRQLDSADVPNNGVQQDALTGATYVSVYDPDGIAWELYVMPGTGER